MATKHDHAETLVCLVIAQQIIRQGEHFVFAIKRNQPQSYEEIFLKEKNRDRYEIRRYRVCRFPALLTKSQEGCRLSVR